MAKDTLELLNHLGWTALRQLNIIGVSMGGMISQELALIIPERIGSLTFVSTAARLVNTIGYWENLRNRINMITIVTTNTTSKQFIPRSPDDELEDVKGRLFSQSWLDAADAYGEFPTNGDRFAAMELKKRQNTEGFTRKGFICQAIAAGWHHKSPEQLEELADKVGRQRIQVLHGTVDRMITVPHGETLARELGRDGEVAKIIVQGRGHVLHMEEQQKYEEWLENIMDKVEDLK
ncbi:MAG: hypothetical protein LQ350_002313 [Teloschistes chrysophthalmus]|nr:MAG: hypothetical protein LQ350_002313 [Niorma chrysophthalma]